MNASAIGTRSDAREAYELLALTLCEVGGRMGAKRTDKKARGKPDPTPEQSVGER